LWTGGSGQKRANMDEMWTNMDKLNNPEEAKRFLQRQGLYIDEAAVRQVANVLSGKVKRSLFSLHATTRDKPAPVCGKGTAYKIKKLYDKGELQPYLDYLANSPNTDETRTEYIEEAEHDVPKESRTKHWPYEENAHKLKMREVAKALAGIISLPSRWDKDLPVEFELGKYSLSIGAVEIDKDKQIKVTYNDPSDGIAGPHLVNGIYSHLKTSGLPKFAELVGDKGKLNNWIGEVEKYSETLLKFLKVIADDVKGYRVKVTFNDEEKPGLTKWFILTAWNDAIQKASDYSRIDGLSYKPSESILGTNLWQLKYGAYRIGIARSKGTIETYENWHKTLMDNYAKLQSVKDIVTKSQELSDIAQDIRQRLQEFSDMACLLGQCELCP